MFGPAPIVGKLSAREALRPSGVAMLLDGKKPFLAVHFNGDIVDRHVIQFSHSSEILHLLRRDPIDGEGSPRCVPKARLLQFLELVEIGACVEFGPGDHVDNFGDDFLAALGLALHRSLVATSCLRGLGSKRQFVVCCFLARLATGYVLRRFRVKLQIDRFPPRRLRSSLCRRQLTSPELMSGNPRSCPPTLREYVGSTASLFRFLSQIPSGLQRGRQRYLSSHLLGDLGARLPSRLK